jgi:hypothetical protein
LIAQNNADRAAVIAASVKEQVENNNTLEKSDKGTVSPLRR